MTEVETHEGVAGFETSHKHSHIRLRTTVRLHVDILRVIELLQTLTGYILRDIDYLAAAVIAVTRVTLCVLVRQHATHRFHHLVTHEILARNQLNSFRLTLPLPANDVKNLIVSIHIRINS